MAASTIVNCRVVFICKDTNDVVCIVEDESCPEYDGRCFVTQNIDTPLWIGRMMFLGIVHIEKCDAQKLKLEPTNSTLPAISSTLLPKLKPEDQQSSDAEVEPAEPKKCVKDAVPDSEGVARKTVVKEFTIKNHTYSMCFGRSPDGKAPHIMCVAGTLIHIPVGSIVTTNVTEDYPVWSFDIIIDGNKRHSIFKLEKFVTTVDVGNIVAKWIFDLHMSDAFQ